MIDPDQAPALARAGAHRTDQIIDELDKLSQGGLVAPSRLPNWSRLTIACHLRYLTQAHSRMTADALAGRPTSFYQGGPVPAAPRHPGAERG